MLNCNFPPSASGLPFPCDGVSMPAESVGRGHKVLIIEDEETLGRNIKEYLEEDGFEAWVCGDGASGLEAFATLRPGVVLLDLRLPGIDGLEILERLRAQDPGARVIMMTAHGGAHVAAAARRAGACTFLAKPLVLSELRQAIGDAL